MMLRDEDEDRVREPYLVHHHRASGVAYFSFVLQWALGRVRNPTVSLLIKGVREPYVILDIN